VNLLAARRSHWDRGRTMDGALEAGGERLRITFGDRWPVAETY
jgi:hypothetical protein